MTKKVGRPLKFTDAKDMEEAINKYFEICDQTKEPYTISGICLALGMTRETLRQYAKIEKFSDLIKMAKLQVENRYEKRALTDDKPAGAIFLLKAHFGYSDRINLEHGMSEGSPKTKLTVEFIESNETPAPDKV